MADTSVAVQIAGSGIPSYQAVPQEGAWPLDSDLLSALLRWVPNISVTPHREMVFLTRSQQRIMNGALRDSLRIIA
jgi:hypothetical protein